MAKVEVKTYAEQSSQNGDDIQVTKDPKYDFRNGSIGKTIHRKRNIQAPYEGVEYVNETKNQYGKKDGTVTFERTNWKKTLGMDEEKEEAPKEIKPVFDKEDYDRAVQAEWNYRRSHGGHSSIGSILRDGYKEPERDKNELMDYEIEARRED